MTRLILAYAPRNCMSTDYRSFLPLSLLYRTVDYDYFGFKTLERSYLLRIDGKVVERPSHMIMRVALGIHMKDIEGALETYNLMSQKMFTHATPTLFNAGTPRPQLSSCFLLNVKEDRCGIYPNHKTHVFAGLLRFYIAYGCLYSCCVLHLAALKASTILSSLARAFPSTLVASALRCTTSALLTATSEAAMALQMA